VAVRGSLQYGTHNEAHAYIEELLRNINPHHAYFLPKVQKTFMGIDLASPTFIAELTKQAASRTLQWRSRIEAVDKLCQMNTTEREKVGIIYTLFSIILDTPRGVRNGDLLACLRGLLHACRSNPEMHVSAADIPVLAQVSGMEAVNLLVPFLSDGNRFARLSAVKALAQIGGEQAESALRAVQTLERDAPVMQTISDFLQTSLGDFKE